MLYIEEKELSPKLINYLLDADEVITVIRSTEQKEGDSYATDVYNSVRNIYSQEQGRLYKA